MTSRSILFFFLLLFTIGSKTLPAQRNWIAKKPFEQKDFVENKGQVQTNKLPNKEVVLYTAFIDGVTYYFTRNGYTISHCETQRKSEKEWEEEEKHGLFKRERKEEKEKEFNFKIVEKFHELKWEGANPNVQVVTEHPVKNYYSYSDPNSTDKKGTIIAHAYTRVIYKELYPHTDVMFEFPKDSTGIKYSIYLHPGADVEKIRMRFPNEAFQLNKSKGVIIESTFGIITDHPPISYVAGNKTPINSQFKIANDQLGFDLQNVPGDKTIVIDPWTVTPVFDTSSAAYDVDFDNLGNVYVYGGPVGETPVLLKYDATGTFIWSYTPSFTPIYYGDFAVDRNSNNIYLVEGFNPGIGARVVKINSSAIILVTFPGDLNFEEMWRIAFSRCTNQAVIAGGGTTSPSYQTCYLDTNLTGINPVSLDSGLVGYHDVGLLALDNYGNCYEATNSSLTGDAIFDNQLVKMPLPALTPTAYIVNTDYAFHEVASLGYDGFANGYNGLTTSNKYVYSYDSYVLKKWDGPTGNLLVYKRINYPASGDSSQIHWGGISADDCGNLFVADSNTVLQYDSTLTLINSYLMPGVITDVNLSITGDLYVCGLGFVSAMTPTGTISCTSGGIVAVNSPVAATCTAPGSASVAVTGGIPPYNIVWSTFPVQYGDTAINLAPGSYPVTITDDACPPHKLIDTVVVPALGGAYLSVPSINSGCPGLNNGSIIITNSGGVAPFNYAWTPVATDTNGIYNLTPGSYYSVTITDNAGCTNTFDSMLVDTPRVMHFSFTHGPIKCFNDTTTLTIIPTDGDTPYTINWTTPSATGFHIYGAQAGDFAGIITDNSGCILPFTDTLTQPSLLTAVISSAFDSVCPGTSVSLSASGTGGTGTYTYSWTSDAGTGSATSYTYTPTVSDTVLLGITDFNNCVANAQHIITMLTLSDPTIAPVPTQCVSAASITLTAATPGGTWLGSGIMDVTNGIFNPAAAGVGSHVITYTLTRPCLSVDTVTILVVRQLSAVITDVGPFCTGTVPLTLNAVDIGGVWAGVGITNTVTGVFDPAVAGVGSHVITYTIDTLCGDIDSTTIVVMATPVISFSADTTEGCQPLSIVFTDTTNQPGGTSFWDFGDGNTSTDFNPTNVYVATGTYTVTLTYTNVAGCATTVVQNNLITVHSQPVAIYTADPQPATIVNPTIHFTDLSLGLVDSWKWSFGTSDSSFIQNPYYTYVDTGSFPIQFTVANRFGCISTTSGVVIIDQIFLFYAPNAFTPDGNGLNDIFTVKGEEIDLRTFEMRIFNRWGELIYRTEDITKGWNGTLNNAGGEAKQDEYVWKVDLKDYSNNKHSYIGKVLLLK